MYFVLRPSMATGTDYAVIGAGGHAKVVVSMLMELGVPPSAIRCFDEDVRTRGTHVLSCEVEAFNAYDGRALSLVAIGDPLVRRRIAREHPDATWATVCHRRAVVDPSATLGAGTVVMAGAVVQAGAVVGQHCILNTNSVVEHECQIGDYCNIGPGAVLCGQVSLGMGVRMGAGSSVREKTTIADGCVVGLGSVVVTSLAQQNELWYGVPATRQRVVVPN